jgi:hypothetical protein
MLIEIHSNDPNTEDNLDEESHYPLFDPNNPDHCPSTAPETPPKRTLTPYPRRSSEGNFARSPGQQGYVGRLANFIRSGASVFHVNTQEQEGKVIPSPESARSLRSIVSKRLRHASAEVPPEEVIVPRSSPIAIQPPRLHLDLPTAPIVLPFASSDQNAFHDIFFDRPMGPTPVSQTGPFHNRQVSIATLGGNLSEDRGYLSGEESNADTDGFEQVEISRAITCPPRSRPLIGESMLRNKSEGATTSGSEPTLVDVENIKMSRRRPSIRRTVSLKRGLSDLCVNRLSQNPRTPGGRPDRIPSTAYEADSEAEDSEPTMGPRKVWDETYRTIRDKKYQEMMEPEHTVEGTTSEEEVLQMGQGDPDVTISHRGSNKGMESIPASSRTELSGDLKLTEALRFEIEAIDRKCGIELEEGSQDEDTLRKTMPRMDNLQLPTFGIPQKYTEAPFCAARLPLFDQDDEFGAFQVPLSIHDASKVGVASSGLGPANDGLHRAIQRVREAYVQHRARSGRLGSSGSDYAITVSNSSRASSGGYPVSMHGQVSVNDEAISTFTYEYPDGFERPLVSFGKSVRCRSRRGDLQRCTEMNVIEVERLDDDAEGEGSWETTYISRLHVSAEGDDEELPTHARLNDSKGSHISLAPDSLSVFEDVSTRHNSLVNLARTLLVAQLARRRVRRRVGLRARNRVRRSLRMGLRTVKMKGILPRLGSLPSPRSSTRRLYGGSRREVGSRDEVGGRGDLGWEPESRGSWVEGSMA